VAKTREALEELAHGDVLEVLADDPETMHDMPLLIGRGPHQLLDVRRQDGEIRFIIEVKA
jgi:TusA-related sulfurtransferase